MAYKYSMPVFALTSSIETSVIINLEAWRVNKLVTSHSRRLDCNQLILNRGHHAT
jgi:hypothetical protein